jgi:diguanylate cyclase (GGDEF)-like protein
MRDQTPNDGRARPSVITLGLSRDATDWLNDRLIGVSVQSTSSIREMLEALSASRRASLLIVNHTLEGPAGVDAVGRVQHAFPDLAIVYILDKRLDSELGRNLLQQMGIKDPLLAPVDRTEFLRLIAHLLEIGAEDSASERGQAPFVADARADGHEELKSDIGRPLPESGGMAAPGAEELPATAGDRPFLLLVDDAADVSERIVADAATQGIRVIATQDVRDGRLKLARELPDALLLDLSLINNSDDGLALLEELDRHALTVPVIFLAERDTLIDRVQAVSLGGRAFLPKTMPPADILKAVSRILQQLQATESRVLAVDDDPRVLEDLRALLAPKGIRLTTLEDPLRFWSTLEQTVPDLLMVDFDLPRWSGLELCKVVRNDTRWSALPVLCLTANADADTVQRVFDAGADDYVSKPIVGTELVTKVVNRLQRIELYRIMAEIDPLTGVANRLKATEALDRLLRLAKRQRQVFSLALLDLDNFKQINDRYGHGTGDEALRRLGSLLARTFRAEDVVARLGGEEFIVGMYGMPRIGGVLKLTTLLESLGDETPPRVRNDGVSLTFSGGVAQFPDDGQDLDALMDAADTAQYRAKESGKNRVFPASWLGGGDEEQPATNPDVVVVTADLQGPEIVRALEAIGYRLQWIRDGESAAMKLGGPDPTLQAQVVLLDLDVPRLDGIKVLSRLSRDGVVARSRVIVIGGDATESRMRRALELGAFDGLTRPINIPGLQQRVRHAMEVP